MALAVDTTETTPGVSGTSVATLSITNYDGGSGENRLMLIHAGNAKPSGVAASSTATYNAVGATSVFGTTFSSLGAIKMYSLVAPATGNNTLTVNWAASQDEISIGAVVLNDAHQTVPYDAYETATGTSTTPSNNYGASASGDIVVDCVYSFSGSGDGVSFAVGASQTQRFNNADIGGGWGGGTMSYEAGGASIDMTHTISGDATQTWYSIAVSVNPVGGAGTNPKGPLGNPFFGPFGGPI